ncbi:MAG: dephospho-CoA kinase [Acidobacteria bacterium]|nr:dephospho-CoA kinase [Acidobacteriota bacterium]
MAVLRVGLTGGIACGRSTLSRFLAERGMLVLDADAVAHSLLARGGAAVEVVAEAFGSRVRAEEGGISRKALGRIVFADAAEREKLERILHPRILAILDADAASFEARRGTGVVIVDAALMVETGSWRRYQRLVVAHCRRDEQLRRLMARDGLTRGAAESRLLAQLPLDRKTALADYLISTDGTLDDTRRETLRVADLLEEDLRSLPRLAPRTRGGTPC